MHINRGFSAADLHAENPQHVTVAAKWMIFEKNLFILFYFAHLVTLLHLIRFFADSMTQLFNHSGILQKKQKFILHNVLKNNNKEKKLVKLVGCMHNKHTFFAAPL